MRLESVIVIVPISVIVSEAAAMDYCVKAHCHVQRGKAAPPPFRTVSIFLPPYEARTRTEFGKRAFSVCGRS